MRPNTEADFWAKVDVRGPDDCWLWKAGKSKSGYGSFQWQGKVVSAHRMALTFHNGSPLPSGREHPVCHRCDVELCCNPAHLYLGTPKQNTADIIQRGRRQVVRKGSAAPFAKFTDEQVREIRRLHAEGWSYPRLGERFGMHPQNIGRICRRQGYTEVE